MFIRDALVFYVSFDQSLRADRGAGALEPRTRFDDETNEGEYIFKDGVDESIFRIAPDSGVHGGALEAIDTLPRRGRIFYPAAGNLAFEEGGWSGSVSVWIKTNPNTMLQTPFCDPVQITEKGATNGGLWIDFPDTEPRDLRLGAFPSEGPGRERISEDDPNAPVVRVNDVGFEATEWHHVAFTWANIDSGSNNAWVALYVDGEIVGNIHRREITMGWNLERTGIYVAVNYIGLLDEFAIFDRPLSADEINRLRDQPGLLSEMDE